ncbi:MAG: LamG domain-containing protein [Solirubrobacteraceae bacterium]
MSPLRRLAAAAAVLVALAVPASASALGDYGATVRATPGLAAYWPLDEAASANTVTDVTGGLSAPLTAGFALGLPPGIDAGGTSLSLTGTSTASFGNVANFAADRTIEAWVAPRTTSGDRYIVSKGTTSAGYHLYMAGGGLPSFQVNGTRVTGPALRAVGWHHVVATLSTRAMALYVDGARVATGTLPNVPATSTQALYLGRLSRSSSGSWQGGLDEVALYSRALDAGEVAAHFAAGADTSAPATIFLTTPPAVSDQPAGTVTFAGSKGGVTFACALDDGVAAPCNGSYAYDLLRDGPHTLSVTGTDRWGTSATSAYSWQVALPANETAAPVSSFLTTPPALANSRTARFTFTASKAQVAFSCRVDGGAWVVCPVGASYTSLGEGRHTFEVRGTDRWGVVETVPRAFTWTIDLTAPMSYVLAKRATPSDPGTVALGSEPGATFECRRAQTAWLPCPATFAMPVLTASEQLFVRAVDRAGNADASPAEVVLDPAVAGGPVTFAGANAGFAVGGDLRIATLLCSLDGAAAAACPARFEFADLGYGPHTLTISDPALVGIQMPAVAWVDPLPRPRIVGSQFPALLQLGSRKRQAGLATARLPRLLFQSNSAGGAVVTLQRGGKTVRRWTAPVVQGSNLVRLPRAAWKQLRPGRYGLRVVVTNASGPSAPLTLRFDALRSARR